MASRRRSTRVLCFWEETEELGIGATRKMSDGLSSLVSSVVTWSYTRAYL
jgi:hypothetical protein